MFFRGRGEGGVTAELLEVRGHGRRSAKGSAPVWPVGTLHVHTCVSVKHICVFVFFSLRAIFLGARKSGQIWAGRLWYKKT